MKLTIIRIEENIITCELEDGQLLDVARKWFASNIKTGDVMDIDVTKVEGK